MAPNFAEMRDDFLAQEEVWDIRPEANRHIPCTPDSPAYHYLNAFVGFLTRRFPEYAGEAFDEKTME